MGIPLGPINESDPAIEVIRSLPPQAPWWVLLLPKLFGVSQSWVSSDVLITVWTWRGKTYLERAVYLGLSRLSGITHLPWALSNQEYNAIVKDMMCRENRGHANKIAEMEVATR